MQKRFLPFVATTVAVMGVFLSACDKKASDGKLKIGVLLPLTGESASYGIDCQNGARLVLDDQADVNVVYEDSREDPNTAITTFRKMASDDHIDALLGSMFSVTSLPLAPVAEPLGVVMLTPASSDEAVPRVGSHIFSLYPSATQEGRLVAEAVRKGGVKRLAVVYQNVKAARDLAKAMSDDLKKSGVEVIAEEVLPEEAINYPSLISKLGDPEAIFVCAYKDPLIRYIAKSKELGVKSRWFSQSTLYEPAAIRENKAILEGVVFTAPYFNEMSTDSRVADFREKYRKKYAQEATVWSAFGYDGAQLLLQACREKKPGQADFDLAAALQKAHLDGVTGTTTFDSQRRPVKQMVIMEIHDGAPRIISP